MTEVICLSSDSDGSISPIPNEAPRIEKVVAAKSSSYSPGSDDDFDFPAVPFAYVPSTNNRKESRDDLLGTRLTDKKNIEASKSGLKTVETNVDSYDDTEDYLYNKTSNTESTSSTLYKSQTRSNSSCNSRRTSGSLSDSQEKTTVHKIGKLSKEGKGKLYNNDEAKKSETKKVEAGECLRDDMHDVYGKSTAKESTSNMSHDSQEESDLPSDNKRKTKARNAGKSTETNRDNLQNDEGMKLKSRRVESGEFMALIKDPNNSESVTTKTSGYSEADVEDELYKKYTTMELMSSMSHDSKKKDGSSNDNQKRARNAGKLTKTDRENLKNYEEIKSKSKRLQSQECMELIKDSIDSETVTSKSSGYCEDDFLDELYRKYTATESTSSLSYDSREKSGSSTDNATKTRGRKAGKLSEEDKEILKAEKLRKQEEAAKLKATKVALAESLKSIKPGECIKFIKVSIDTNLTNSVFCPELLTALQLSEIRYVVESQLTPNSITWERNVQNHYVGENHKVCTRSKTHAESQMIIIWNWNETVRRVKDRTFVETVANNLAMAPSKDVTLLVYGIEEYFRHQKNMKKRAVKNFALENDKDKGRIKSSKTFEGSPIISRRELELLLTEIQVTINAKHRLVETPQDLGLVVCQYTKAIAEAPFKLEKRQKLQDKMDWYVSGDNKDCVRVDKDGNGLRTLWQQQLCQFNLARMETAQAITSKYPSPLRLMEAYMNCTPAEGEKLLQDIPIRRAAGPLTATRRIGPELSKKVYVMFTSEDGESTLDNV